MDMSKSGLPLAIWQVKVIPNIEPFRDREYEAGVCAINETEVIERIQKVLKRMMEDNRMEHFILEIEQL